MELKIQKLKDQWIKLKQQEQYKKIRIKDAADLLNVSEAELLSTTIGNNTEFIKSSNWSFFLQEISSIGEMMYLIRNDDVVHENITTIAKLNILDNQFIELYSNQSQTIINVLLIKFAFVTTAIIRGKSVHSFQLFDKSGKAIIKIYLKNNNQSEFDAIKNKYQAPYKYELQKLMKNQNIKNQKVHLKQNLISYINRFQNNQNYSIELMEKMKYEKSTISLHNYLIKIVETKSKITIGINNGAALQTYSGYIENVIHKFNWLNIMDKNFNLHIKDENIKSIFYNRNNDELNIFGLNGHLLYVKKIVFENESQLN